MRSLFIVFTIAAFTLSLSSCSTCYECTEDVILYDDNTGQPIDTTTNTDDFCTADQAEVDDREAEGADCREN